VSERPLPDGARPLCREGPPGGRSLAWVDGRIVDASEPALVVTDRGFQLGDGLFETLRARRGVAIEWSEHLARLREGAERLAIRLPSVEVIGDALRDLLDAAGLGTEGRGDGEPGDASVRITVSRGSVASRGTLPTGWRDAEATVVIQAWPHAPPAPALLSRGIRAVTSRVVRDPRSPLATVKTTSRADSVYAKLEAERAGVDDAIYPTPEGDLTEATSANLFVIRGDTLITPGLDRGILAGTTRTWLLTSGVAARHGLRAVERALGPSDVLGADEALLCATVSGVLPLVELDGRPIGSGRPGTRTLGLRDAREAWIDEQSIVG
jgi:branched-chain amino acid aminotransferase